jgi:hypothetical protein
VAVISGLAKYVTIHVISSGGLETGNFLLNFLSVTDRTRCDVTEPFSDILLTDPYSLSFGACPGRCPGTAHSRNCLRGRLPNFAITYRVHLRHSFRGDTDRSYVQPDTIISFGGRHEPIATVSSTNTDTETGSTDDRPISVTSKLDAVCRDAIRSVSVSGHVVTTDSGRVRYFGTVGCSDYVKR